MHFYNKSIKNVSEMGVHKERTLNIKKNNSSVFFQRTGYTSTNVPHAHVENQ